jgi:hypothetical protein
VQVLAEDIAGEPTRLERVDRLLHVRGSSLTPKSLSVASGWTYMSRSIGGPGSAPSSIASRPAARTIAAPR